MKKQANKIYKNLQKRKNAIKIRAYIMSGFLLAINSFAWFVFISNGKTDISADVIAWDIVFLDEKEQAETLDVVLSDLYPGMPLFSQQIVVQNRSDLNAKIDYIIEGITVYGEEFATDDYKKALEEEFPFEIKFSYEKETILINEKTRFTINATWDFESDEAYYKLNELYDYSPMYNYYILQGSNYVKTDVTQANYDALVASGLYVESDDADSFWGEKSVTYRKDHPGESAFRLKVKLIVSQDNVE